MSSNECLLAIDGLNVIRRVHEGNPAPDSPEKAAITVRNSLGSLRRALQEHQPTHAVLAMDQQAPNWRHDLYADYRAGRKPMPECLQAVLPEIREAIEALGIRVISRTGLEADDLLATLAHRWGQRSASPCIVLSTDKDLCQLLSLGDWVRVRDHFKPEWRTRDWVVNKFGVAVEQLGDFLALMGDTVDGVPGVPKVGQGTASKLLNEHHTLEAVLSWARADASKLAQRLCDHEADARLSRALVGFKTDEPLGVCWNDLRLAA